MWATARARRPNSSCASGRRRCGPGCKDAGPGDVFPFASELGPPRYAITLPDGREFSDRWEQSLVMKRLAEQAWEKAET